LSDKDIFQYMNEYEPKHTNVYGTVGSIFLTPLLKCLFDFNLLSICIKKTRILIFIIINIFLLCIYRKIKEGKHFADRLGDLRTLGFSFEARRGGYGFNILREGVCMCMHIVIYIYIYIYICIYINIYIYIHI
jgi:hypothetical protein